MSTNQLSKSSSLLLFVMLTILGCQDLEEDLSVSVNGTVSDKSTSQPLPNVRVSLTVNQNVILGEVRTAVTEFTDSNGVYSISYSDPDFNYEDDDWAVRSLEFNITNYTPASFAVDFGDHIVLDVSMERIAAAKE